MDENKKLTLQEIEYKIHNTCDLCAFGKFKSQNNFGNCLNNHYKHLKHTDSYKYLSIHRCGSCNDFTWDFEKQSQIQHFEEFIDDTR